MDAANVPVSRNDPADDPPGAGGLRMPITHERRRGGAVHPLASNSPRPETGHLAVASDNVQRIFLLDCHNCHLDYRKGSGNTVEIYDIEICNSHRRQRRGRTLVDLLLDKYLPPGTNMVFAITRPENVVAQQFYSELRFRVIGVLWDFYDRKGRADAIMYGRHPGSQA